jgi:hypothetical protein
LELGLTVSLIVIVVVVIAFVIGVLIDRGAEV